MDNTYNTIIVGGGASGLIAAITAARRKQEVLIVEKNKSLGKKILVSGNGRCNLTNTNISPDKYYGENTKCLNNIFARFSSNDTINFFEKLGVKLKTDSGGRVFPASDKASTILDALIRETTRLHVKVNLNERVIKIIQSKTNWQITTDKNSYQTKSVIMTTGGKSYPQLGSIGDGYEIAREMGHTIIKPRPALVPLELEGTWFKSLQGIQTTVKITVKQQQRTLAQKTGDLLFTHFGISGPVVLDLSRVIINLLNKPNLNVSINYLPEHTNTELISYIKNQPKKILPNILAKLIPKKIIEVLLDELKIDMTKQASQITKKEIQLIIESLFNWQLDIKKPRPFQESMVTAGGLAMDEIHPKTMESLKVKGLYFAGETMDIDGVSGGYNLQFAWSTGYLAGNAA